MRSKRLRILAGPNGSGKSSVYNDLRKLEDLHLHFGVFVNADEIENSLRAEGMLDVSRYGITIERDKFIEGYTSFFNVVKGLCEIDNINFEENHIISVSDVTLIDSYFASYIADFVRNAMMDAAVDVFTIETVMSHRSKIDFLYKAKENGYRIYLYYVSTKSPTINKERVNLRVQEGGHDVPEDKIELRYYRSLDLLYDAILASDRVFFFDNSEKQYNFFAEYCVSKDGGNLNILCDDLSVPEWFSKYVIDKIIT